MNPQRLPQTEPAAQRAGRDPAEPSRRAKNPQAGDDRLWTVDDVSYYLGVPVSTLYQWRCGGRGPRGRRIGRYVRYRPADVKAWVAALDSAGIA